MKEVRIYQVIVVVPACRLRSRAGQRTIGADTLDVDHEPVTIALMHVTQASAPGKSHR
jgi:hypothetical protein